MNLGLCILVTFLLTAAGYIYLVKYFFYSVETTLTKETILKIDVKRVVYIAVSVLAGLGLSLTFKFIYSGTTILTQIKIISLVMMLLPISVIDLKQRIIPNKILIFGVALRIIFYLVEFVTEGSDILVTLKSDFIGALIVVLFFLLCMLIAKNSIGMGDVKLFGLMGLYQGLWGVMSSIFFSLFVAFILSIVLLVSRKRGRKDSIPFGPSILLGTYVAIILTGI